MDSPPVYRRLPSQEDIEVQDSKELSLSYYAGRIHSHSSLPSYTPEPEPESTEPEPESDSKTSSQLFNAILFITYSLTLFILFDALSGRTYSSRIFVTDNNLSSPPSFGGEWTGSSNVLEDLLSSGSCFTSASRSIFCYNAQLPEPVEIDMDELTLTSLEIKFTPPYSSSHMARSLPSDGSDGDSESQFDASEEDHIEEESTSSSFTSLLTLLQRKFHDLGLQTIFDTSHINLLGEQYEMDLDGSVARIM